MRKTCKLLTAFLGSLAIIAFILAYSQYVALKKTLIAQISDKATALIDQKVEIGDIFLDSAAGIVISDLRIKNPAGFIQGDLLRISRIRIDMRYRELLHGRFSFRAIEVLSPELTLMTIEDRLNISEKFRRFFSGKGTAEYLISGFSIKEARINFNNDPLYGIRDLGLFMSNLSSVQDTKTSFKASLTYWDTNRMTLEGWAFLKDKTKKFSISALSDNIDLSVFGRHISKYGMNPEKSRGNLLFKAEGDAEQGIKVSAEARINDSGITIFRKRSGSSISLTTEAFLDFGSNALTIDKALLTVGDAAAIQAKVRIQGLSDMPSYLAEIRISRLDLASLNFMHGLKAGGIIMSDQIRIEGTLSSALPKATGTITVSNGSLGMDRADIQGLNAKIAFASSKDLSVNVGASGRLLRAGDIAFESPVEIQLKADGKGSPERMRLKSEIGLSGIRMALKGKDIKTGHVRAYYDGKVSRKAMAGNASLEARDLAYDIYRTRHLRTDLDLEYAGSTFAAKNLKASSDIFTAAADIISVTLPGKKGKAILQAKNLSAAYPDKKAALKGLDCIVSVSGRERDLSGDLSFSARQVSFQDISSGPVAGKGSIDRGSFMLHIPSAKLFEGSVRLIAKGRSSAGPFPVSLALKAENLSLGAAFRASGAYIRTPYSTSGSADLLSFDGTVYSPKSITGSAAIRGRNISITNANNRAMLKNAAVSSDLVFQGSGMQIKADASVSGLALALSGTGDNVFEDSRLFRLSLHIPEIMAGDIRAAFWDIFPDRLLYAGLDGSVSVNLSTTLSSNAVTADGGISLNNISIEGENREYSIGPVNGMLPIHYHSKDRAGSTASLQIYERDNFDELKKEFSGSKYHTGKEITIGSVRYGFRLLQDISLWVEQTGRSLKINSISAKMFGGRVRGTALADFGDGLHYRAGIITDGVSLTELCNEMPPIRGYISGRIDGIAAIKGSGAGLARVTGKADFWTYSAEEEKTSISREFLEKLGGPQVKAYLGERRFDKGIMGIYLQKGFIIFRELEISNRNFLGITDLSVKVAPLNNRISIDHLMWTMIEAAQRAKKK